MAAGLVVVRPEFPAEGDDGLGAGLVDHFPTGQPVEGAVDRAGVAGLAFEGFRIGPEPVGDGLPRRPAGAEDGDPFEQAGRRMGLVG
ncbi:MAG: hypothetical protein K2X87_16720 [Gemmataceae bacterium]|nr:hypothetical protein [Gemmataceae bacterium]